MPSDRRAAKRPAAHAKDNAKKGPRTSIKTALDPSALDFLWKSLNACDLIPAAYLSKDPKHPYSALRSAFALDSQDYEDKALFERCGVICTILHALMPEDLDALFAPLSQLLIDWPLPPKGRKSSEHGWTLVPLGTFISAKALDSSSVQRALELMLLMTPKMSAEFCARELFVRWPEQMAKGLFEAAKTAKTAKAAQSSAPTLAFNEDIRRLASEALRPQLPWSFALDWSKGPYRAYSEAILGLLAEDDSAYVQKSVANHLSDIAKRDKELFFRLLELHPFHPRIKKLSLQRVLRRGEKGAAKGLGLGEAGDLKLRVKAYTKELRMGEDFCLELDFEHRAEEQKSYVIYVVFYLKGARQGVLKREKIYLLGKKTLKALEKGQWQWQRPLKESSVLKLYAGPQAFALRVGTGEIGGGGFVLKEKK